MDEAERAPDYEIYQKTCIQYPSSSCTIAHTQLCHQLWINPNDDTQVFYVQGFTIRMLDTRNQESTIKLSLKFEPQSMCTGEGHLAACGSRGELIIVLLSNFDIMFNATTTQNVDMNNAVNIGYHRDQLRLAVASNDNSVKIFSLKTYERVFTIEFMQCMNYASVSPDGKKLVAVGDCPEVAVFNITEDLKYDRIASVSMSPEWGCCFSADWDATSSLFAVIQQSPGLVVVWEFPSLNVVARLTPSGDSECRAVKFYSPKDSGLNLLVFSERTDQVQVVDINSEFKRKQILAAVPPAQTPRNRRQKVSGFAVTSNYDKLFVGKADAIYAFEKTQPYSLKEICLKLISKSPAVFPQPTLKSSLTEDLLDELDAIRNPTLNTPNPENAAEPNNTENNITNNNNTNYPTIFRRPFSSLSDEEEELFEEFSHYLMSFRRYRALNRQAEGENNNNNAEDPGEDIGDEYSDSDDDEDDEDEAEGEGKGEGNEDADGERAGTTIVIASEDSENLEEPTPTTTTSTTTTTTTSSFDHTTDPNNNNNEENQSVLYDNKPTTSDNSNNNNDPNNNNNDESKASIPNSNFKYNVRHNFTSFAKYISGKDENQIREMLARLNYEIRLMEVAEQAHQLANQPPNTTTTTTTTTEEEDDAEVQTNTESTESTESTEQEPTLNDNATEPQEQQDPQETTIEDTVNNNEPS